MFLWWQDKALAELDKEECPAESNESDSEDAAVDQERALAEKGKVDKASDVKHRKLGKSRSS